MLSVWPMFASSEPVIWGCDRQVEVAVFHRDLARRSIVHWPKGLLDAEAFVNRRFPRPRHSTSVMSQVGRIRELLVADLLNRQERWRSFFETVVQIGCFGCLDSIEALERALGHVAFYLRPGGRFISATWLPRPPYVESERWGGMPLTTLPADAFVGVIAEAGLLVRDTRVSPTADPEYRERYVIVAERQERALVE